MLGLIFIAPFLLLLVLFTLSNASEVQLGLWPTDFSIQAPLSIAVLVVSAVFFLLGAIVVGLGSLAQRRRARRAESRVRTLETEVAQLKLRLTPDKRVPDKRVIERV
jgi:lipopolysaccharide assembly protein A